eukprot:scaffold373_cov61-Cylindrotheca_fusiformis.AAC.2
MISEVRMMVPRQSTIGSVRSIPRTSFGIDKISEVRMMVPRQSTVGSVRKFSEVIVWDRSNFRSSNDGSATINRRKCQNAAESIFVPWFGIDQTSEKARERNLRSLCGIDQISEVRIASDSATIIRWECN